MKLYEINQAIEEAFWNCVDPDTGEIVGDRNELDALTIARDEKIENIALLIKELKAEEKAIADEERKLQKRRRTCEKGAERLKKYLAENLNGERFKTPRVSISHRTTHYVDIGNIWQIPVEYLKIEDPKPKREEIKQALKNGIEVKGAKLGERTSIIIS